MIVIFILQFFNEESLIKKKQINKTQFCINIILSDLNEKIKKKSKKINAG